MTTVQRLATVHPITAPVAGDGFLPYRWAELRRAFWRTATTPPPDIHLRMALVEDQLAIAFEQAENEPEVAIVLLRSAGCRLSGEQIGRAYDLSQQVADLETSSSAREWHDAIDAYTDHLHHLAIAVRAS